MTERPAPETGLSSSVVSSFNEWDPLEEVIVGHVEHAMAPPWDAVTPATMPKASLNYFREHGARPFPREAVDAARPEIEELVHILEAEGVTVRRPAVVDFSRYYATPEWSCEAGLYAAMPRDVLLVFGDEIIEVPMAWRCRYHELAVNPDRVRSLPEMFRTWDVLEAPRPCRRGEARYRMCSDWISMNVLMLDPERVVVERREEPLVRALREWGFKPVLCSIDRFNAFGGGFHCCTLDVRRRGKLESYF